MRILLVSNNFPPEVNALAGRSFEHARYWVRQEKGVEVLTDVPHYPEGVVYPGYHNRVQRTQIEGIDVLRVPMYVAENRGKIRRTLSYLSFMVSAMLFGRQIKDTPDIVLATSPQFFSPLAGLALSKRFKAPFVLEIRDLWPASIVAVGALRRGLIIRLLEVIERFIYSRSDHIVVVTDSFKRILVGRGVPEKKVTVIKNGVTLAFHDACTDETRLSEIRTKYGLEGKFVVSYIGTIGMAHRVDVLVEAAKRCEDENVVFMIVGAGAERPRIARMISRFSLNNVQLVDKQPRASVPCFMRVTDVAFVHLRDDALFHTVIPSKMFEAMLLGKPTVLGVEGEAKDILEVADAGIAVPPENPDAIVEAIMLLKHDPERCRQLGENGKRYVRRFHDREQLAQKYLVLLEQLVGLDVSDRSNHKSSVAEATTEHAV